MRLVTFSLPGAAPRPGLIAGDEIVDLGDPANGLPASMVELLALGPAALDRAHVAEMGREPPAWQYWFNKQRCVRTQPRPA